jgi:SAM-dependent methyltransferase
MVIEMLSLTGREGVLDVGCGTGEYSQLLAYGSYVGVDFNPEYIDWARQAYGRDGVSFHSMDVADVPKLRLNLESAFCIAVTHHLSDSELKKMVADVMAAVSDRFVIVDLILPPVWRNPLSHFLIRIDRGRHGRTKERLLQVLGATGFRVERVGQTFGFPHRVAGISLRRPEHAS